MKLKKFIKTITSMPVVVGIQIIATSVFLFFVFKLDLLPLKYIIAIAAFVLLALGLFIFVHYTSVKKHGKDGFSRRSISAKIISVIVSVLLLMASSYIVRGDKFINNISSVNENTYLVSIIVLKDNKAKDLQDVKDKNFGVCYKNDTEILTEAIAHFEDKIGTQKYTKVDDYVKLADSLYSKEVDAIIVGDEYKSMLEAKHENFDTETRVVDTYEITKKAKTTTTIPTNVTEEPFNIYITGIDAYGKVSTRSRSDVNLIVTVNPKTKQILMTSIPRDTEVILHSKQAMDKLTHAGIIGHEETVNTIQDFLDIKINYYARTNFSGMIDIVDALDGVTIDSPLAFETLHGGYQIKKGINEMDGDMALCFVRERYEFLDGDFQRGRNQQLLLKALLDKAMSPKIITNFSNILGAIEGAFETDMSSTEIKSLLNMQISDMSDWEVFNVQVDGVGYKTTETYSMYNTETYVNKPTKKVVQGIKDLIDDVEAGKIITEEDVKGLN